MKLCYKSFFMSMLSDKALILPLVQYGGPKMQFYDVANNAGRSSKAKQMSRGLAAIAELLVCINYPFSRWRPSVILNLSNVQILKNTEH